MSDIDRVAARLLGREGLTSVEWVYLKMALTGLGNPEARYVMIDEAQDYSQGQHSSVPSHTTISGAGASRCTEATSMASPACRMRASSWCR